MTNNTNNEFFSNLNMFNISENSNRTDILEYIKTHSPISIWDLVKQLKINRNTLYFAIRDFEFAGLIKTKLKMSKQNRKVRIIYYNQSKRGQNKF